MSKIKISPVGSKILVLPKEVTNFKTESGVETVNMVLDEAEIVEVGTDLLGLYLIGDKVIYPKNSGVTQMYNHKPHLWLNGQSVANGGDVWGVVTTEEKEEA